MSATTAPAHMLQSSLLAGYSRDSAYLSKSSNSTLPNGLPLINNSLKGIQEQSVNTLLKNLASVTLTCTQSSLSFQSKPRDGLLVNTLLVNAQVTSTSTNPLSINTLLVSTQVTSSNINQLSTTLERSHNESVTMNEIATARFSKLVNTQSKSQLVKTVSRIEQSTLENDQLKHHIGTSHALGKKLIKMAQTKAGKPTKEKLHVKKSQKAKLKDADKTISEEVRKQPHFNLHEVDEDFKLPSYRLAEDISDINFDKPLIVMKDLKKKPIVDDVMASKKLFVNTVSASLIQSPDFRQPDDPVRSQIVNIANKLSSSDPEFILKVALYTRRELNIRTTANFLLTYASNNAACRPFLAKYYSETIRLPSDWIDVAEQYQVFLGRTGTCAKSVPAALRRAMVKKFKDFDQYQLAKYNKESSQKKKNKKTKKKKVPTATLR